MPKILIIQSIGSNGAYFPIYNLTTSYQSTGFYKGFNYYLSFDYQSGSLDNAFAKFDKNNNTIYWYAKEPAANPQSLQNNNRDTKYIWYTLV